MLSRRREMERKIIQAILILSLILISSCCETDATTTYTPDQVKVLIEESCNTTAILTFDPIYRDYQTALTIAKQLKVDKNLDYKTTVFDCEDISFYVKAHVAHVTSQTYNNGPAVFFGVAFVHQKAMNLSHALNILMYRGKIMLYDYQNDTLRYPGDYLSKDWKIIFVMM